MKRYAGTLFFVFSVFFLSGLTAQAAPDAARTAVSPKEIKLRASMNGLFTQCLDRQRTLAIKTLAGADDADEAMVDLEETIDDIGGVFKTYYGEDTGGQITRLLKQYIQLSADYAEFLREHEDTTAMMRGMHDKAGEIAGMFNSLSSDWLDSGLSDALKEYSDLVVDEIEMQDGSFGEPDKNIFSETFDTSVEMSDIFSAGIIRQFPDKFRQ